MDGLGPAPLELAPSGLAPGREVWLKREDAHELGSFKWRGALPTLRTYRELGAHTVVTASTGNHGGQCVGCGPAEHGSGGLRAAEQLPVSERDISDAVGAYARAGIRAEGQRAPAWRHSGRSQPIPSS